MRVYFFLVIGLAIMSSCSPKLTFYTEDLHNSLGFNEQELRQVQFYLSEELVLERAADLDQAEIREGRITLSRDRELERIRIPAKTQGAMVVSPDGKKLAISFEDGSDSNYLIFGPVSNLRGQYMLRAREWRGRSAVVTYGGKTYTTGAGAHNVGLKVQLRALEKQKVESRTVGGRKP